MTPTPDREPAPQRGPSVVGLVNATSARAVRDATSQTSSPYLGHVRRHRDLGQLRKRLTLLEQRRPDLLAEVADQLEVSPTSRDVAAAAQHLADRLLDRLYERADPDADAISRVSTAADAPAARLRAVTAQHVRAPSCRPASPGGQMRC